MGIGEETIIAGGTLVVIDGPDVEELLAEYGCVAEWAVQSSAASANERDGRCIAREY